MNKQGITTDPRRTQASRRAFLQSAASGAIGGALASRIASPAFAFGAGAERKLRIGLIGCGGRGSGAAAQALAADDHVELSAMGDLFQDQLQRSLDELLKVAPGKVKVAPDRCFLGFDAYQKVIQSGVDVVLLTTPPGFRPQHLRAAVEAGKHAFVEITAAIDAPGVRSVLESAALRDKRMSASCPGSAGATAARTAPRCSSCEKAPSAKSGPSTPPTTAAVCPTNIMASANRT